MKNEMKPLLDKVKSTIEKLEKSVEGNKVQIFVQLVFRGLTFALLFYGVRLALFGKEDTSSFVVLLASGLLNGINYGFHNNKFLHESKQESNVVLHRSHIIWEHIISGSVAAVSLFILILRLRGMYQDEISLSGQDLILFVIAVLGYCGFLPMFMWFFSQSISVLEKLLTRK